MNLLSVSFAVTYFYAHYLLTANANTEPYNKLRRVLRLTSDETFAK